MFSEKRFDWIKRSQRRGILMLGLGGFLFTFHYHYHACTVAPPLSPLPHITFKILYIIYIITAKQPNKYVIIIHKSCFSHFPYLFLPHRDPQAVPEQGEK
jgi:hypothetical protein